MSPLFLARAGVQAIDRLGAILIAERVEPAAADCQGREPGANRGFPERLRTFGGPRLAPRWSPRKTWAGLAGGTVCAALTGWATATWLGISPVLPLAVVSAGLAIVEQFGDLAESVAKRRFGVKDSSGLIPGHGGLLDRLDGLLVVIPVVALLTLIGGRSLLAWQ